MSAAGVTAVERVLDILEAFHAARKPLSLTDLAQAAGIPKSSCHAIVATLVVRGYFYTLKKPRALYPTRRFYDIARDIHRSDPLVDQVMPLLERLRDACRETVILGKRQADKVVYLQVLEGPHSIRYSARPGEFKPLHSSAIGKALLGSLKEDELRAELEGLDLHRVTEATVTRTEDLVADLLASRRRGYFLSQGENVPDVWAVSTFITINAETIGVAIAGPKHRMEANLQECIQLLLATCSFMAKQLSRAV